MSTAAREEAERRSLLEMPADTYAWEQGFIAGAEWRDAQVATLLEAARAYRDAHARHWNNRGRYGAWLDAAMDALCEAARTFEADQG